MEIENLGEIADAARDFVYEPENWEGYQEMKTSESRSLPVEFMALAELVERYYGPRPDNWGEFDAAKR